MCDGNGPIISHSLREPGSSVLAIALVARVNPIPKSAAHSGLSPRNDRSMGPDRLSTVNCRASSPTRPRGYQSHIHKYKPHDDRTAPCPHLPEVFLFCLLSLSSSLGTCFSGVFSALLVSFRYFPLLLCFCRAPCCLVSWVCFAWLYFC